MPKVNIQTFRHSPTECHEWVVRQDAMGAFAYIIAFSPEEDELHGDIYVDALREYPALDTWRDRLKTAWKALRGELWCGELEFYTPDAARAFIKDLEEGIKVMEGKHNE